MILKFRNVAVKSEGPAVTLKITSTNRIEYSIDLTLAIKEKTWPEEAEEWKTRPRAGNITIDTLTYLMAIKFRNQQTFLYQLFVNYLHLLLSNIQNGWKKIISIIEIN